MTEKDLAMIVQSIAPIIREHVDKAVQDSQTRLAVVESHQKAFGDVRDRVLVMETKSALPLPDVPRVDLAPVLERLAFAESQAASLTVTSRDLADVRDRVVRIETKSALPVVAAPELDTDPIYARLSALEARTSVPGPPGVDGAPGKDGAPGIKGELGPAGDHGADGLPGPPGRDGRDGLPGIPGEKGLPGLDGKDGLTGRDGLNGKDGTAGLSFEGVYQEGKSYEPGQLSTWAGSTWHCNEPTTSRPGESKDWTLMVKRGRDGRDGLNGKDVAPVVKVST